LVISLRDFSFGGCQKNIVAKRQQKIEKGFLATLSLKKNKKIVPLVMSFFALKITLF
jgi:hypothetical protein